MSDNDPDSNQADTETSKTLLALLPFTLDSAAPSYYGLQYPEEDFTANLAYSHMAAALLAIDDFNSRNPVVVVELHDLITPIEEGTNLTDSCGGLQFSDSDLLFVNSNGSPLTVSQCLLEEVAYRNKRLLAMVGAYTNEAALTAAQLAAGMDVPLVSHGADDFTFARYVSNPRAARVVPTLHGLADAVVNYFLHQGRFDFIATVHVTREIGDQYMQGIDNAVKELKHPLTGAKFQRHDTYSVAPPFAGFEANVGFGYALREIKRSGARNIFLVIRNFPMQLPIVADYAEAFGLNNGEYVWMMGMERQADLSELVSLASTNVNIIKLLNGMGHVAALDGFLFNEQGDSFHAAWKQQDGAFVERLNTLHPIQAKNQKDATRLQKIIFNCTNHDPELDFYTMLS